MKKKPVKQGPRREWTPFVRTQPVWNEAIVAKMDEDFQQYSDLMSGKQAMMQNSHYVVIVKDIGDGFIWLSIRRLDRGPIRDWRHFQRIKNELVGPEREAVELFPAESRLVDAANQYHLWVLPEGQQLPVGFNRRLVSDTDEAATIGAVQRPLEVS